VKRHGQATYRYYCSTPTTYARWRAAQQLAPHTEACHIGQGASHHYLQPSEVAALSAAKRAARIIVHGGHPLPPATAHRAFSRWTGQTTGVIAAEHGDVRAPTNDASHSILAYRRCSAVEHATCRMNMHIKLMNVNVNCSCIPTPPHHHAAPPTNTPPHLPPHCLLFTYHTAPAHATTFRALRYATHRGRNAMNAVFLTVAVTCGYRHAPGQRRTV